MRIPGDHRLPREEQPPPLAFLVRFARAASDGALALYAAAGLLGTALLLTRGSHWWVLIPTFVALASFGLWGIVDRSLGEHRALTLAGETSPPDLLSRGLLMLRGTLAVAGVVAAIAAVLLPLSASLDNVVH